MIETCAAQNFIKLKFISNFKCQLIACLNTINNNIIF